MLLSILIPTLNRSSALIENIKYLESYIDDANLYNYVEILVSDNNSNIRDVERIKAFIPSVKCQSRFFFQETNIGFERNVLFLLGECHGKYAMTLGDDDFLSFELFHSIIEYLLLGDYRLIVCNYVLTDEHGKVISDPRDPVSKDLYYSKNDYRIVPKGHQMSCLVFCTDGLYDNYMKNCKRNLYPQVYFLGYNISLGEGVHITRYPYKCTLIQKKNFEYKFDNLLSEICVAYDCLPFLSNREKSRYIKIFLGAEKDRFINRETFFNPIRFIYLVLFKYNISYLFKRKLIKFFIIENFKLPFIYIDHLFRGKKT